MNVNQYMMEKYGAVPSGGCSNSDDCLWTFCVYIDSGGERYIVLAGEKDTQWQVFRATELI